MNWLRKLFHLCEHKWETITRYRVDSTITGHQVGEIVVLQCVHCGDVKQRRIHL